MLLEAGYSYEMAQTDMLDGYLDMMTHSDGWVAFTYSRLGVSGKLLSRPVAQADVAKFISNDLGLDPQIAAAFQERSDDEEKYSRRVELDSEVFKKYFLS
jgi:hypothetical protein